MFSPNSIKRIIDRIGLEVYLIPSDVDVIDPPDIDYEFGILPSQEELEPSPVRIRAYVTPPGSGYEAQAVAAGNTQQGELDAYIHAEYWDGTPLPRSALGAGARVILWGDRYNLQYTMEHTAAGVVFLHQVQLRKVQNS